jgi:hypothetical protein
MQGKRENINSGEMCLQGNGLAGNGPRGNQRTGSNTNSIRSILK